jgi:hypothetical protein
MDHGALRRVVVAGGTGLVGQALVRALLAQGTQVAVLTRNPLRATLPEGACARGWDELPGVLDGADAVINLAGEGIADGRWSAVRKAAIRDSRVKATRRLVTAMAACGNPPAVLVNASAIGFYGARGTEALDEHSPAGTGFLPEVCQAWEGEAQAASKSGVRTVCIRIGVVLARAGGALPRMARPVRWFQGCKLGSGQQGLSWIHLDDLVAMFLEAASNPAWQGVFNGTAPEPLSNQAFTRLLAQRLHRPMWPLPGFLTTAFTRLLLGELAEALLLQGAFVLPDRAQALGFAFRFPTAQAALEDLL